VGVAKQAKVVAVRVLDCSGSGSISNVVAGMEWVAQHAVRPAVAVLSLGVAQGSWSYALKEGVLGLVEAGVSVVVASGGWWWPQVGGGGLRWVVASGGWWG
jgi:subtilisin family serine protease